MAELAQGHGLASAVVVKDSIYVFATRAIFTPGQPGEAMFNTSVCPAQSLH
ncbi:MAG: hypothetical protein V2A65_03190 [Candidatus Omnitrophota bacterium]